MNRITTTKLAYFLCAIICLQAGMIAHLFCTNLDLSGQLTIARQDYQDLLKIHFNLK